MSSRRDMSAGAVFLGSLCLYLLTAGGHLYTADDWAKFKVTEALVEHGDIGIPREPHVYSIPGRQGKWVSIFPLGTSVAALPLYFAGRALALVGTPARDIVLRGSVSVLNQFVVAASCAVLFLLLRRTGSGKKRALLVTYAYAVATMAWPYAKHFWSEPAATLCLMGATLVLWKHRKPMLRSALAIGLLCGGACLFKYEMVLFFPAVLWWMLRRVVSGRERLRVFAAWAVGAGLLAMPALWYNWARFGSPWEVAYGGDVGAEAGSSFGNGGWGFHSVMRNLYVTLFSPGRGVLWYNLPLLATGLGWVRLARTQPARARFIALAVAPLLLFLVFTSRSATWAWGPRLLFPLVPFLLIPAVHGGRWLKVAVLGGAIVNLGGVGVNFHDGIEEIRTTGGFDGWEWTQAVEDQPRYSPLLWHFKLLTPYTKRTIQAIAARPSARGWQEGIRGYDVSMRKDSLDVIWLILAAAGLPRAPIVGTVVVLGAVAFMAWRTARKWCEQ